MNREHKQLWHSIAIATMSTHVCSSYSCQLELARLQVVLEGLSVAFNKVLHAVIGNLTAAMVCLSLLSTHEALCLPSVLVRVLSLPFAELQVLVPRSQGVCPQVPNPK